MVINSDTKNIQEDLCSSFIMSFSLKVKRIYVGFGNGKYHEFRLFDQRSSQRNGFFRQTTDLMLLYEVSFNEVFDTQEGRFLVQNKTPKHQSSRKSRKSFLEQIISDFFCT